MGVGEELLEYLRLHVCISSASVALFGYLSFHPYSTSALLAFFSMALVVGSIYSYNFITDRLEDEGNARLLSNRFVRVRHWGALVSGMTAVAGLLLSALLSPLHLLISGMLLAIGHGYSFLRLKRGFLLKNVSIGLAFGLAYLYGAGFVYLPGFSFVLLVIIAMSAIADLRDYEGDRAAGIRTIPVTLGPKRTKQFIAILLLAALLIIAFSDLQHSFALIFFIPSAIAVLNLHKNPYLAHLYMRSGLVTLVFVALLLSLSA